VQKYGTPLLAPTLHGSLISAQPCSSALPYTLIYSFVTLSAAKAYVMKLLGDFLQRIFSGYRRLKQLSQLLSMP
jgi:hypothetical protein